MGIPFSGVTSMIERTRSAMMAGFLGYVQLFSVSQHCSLIRNSDSV